MTFSRCSKAWWLFWRASDEIICINWREVQWQGKRQLQKVQVMIPPDYGYEAEIHRREIFASIGEARIIKRCEDLKIGVLWALCYWQEDKGEVWYRDSPTEGILDYILTDVWGPTKTASLRGNHYFVLLIDDFFRRSWVYTMRHQNEVLNLFVRWKTRIGSTLVQRSRYSNLILAESTRVIPFYNYVKMKA